jgi:hypothetical protein
MYGTSEPEEVLLPLDLATTRPYVSVAVVRYTGHPENDILSLAMKQLRERRLRAGRGTQVRVVAEVAPRVLNAHEITRDLESAGFVVEVSRTPAWANGDLTYREVSYGLIIAMRRGNLVAIHGDSTMMETLQSWLSSDPPPAFSRLSPNLINAVFLGDDAKGLTFWLRAVHHRTSTKPDAKVLAGSKLQDALDPLADSSYALGSAVVSPDLGLAVGLTFKNIVKRIGTTQRKSTFWLGRVPSFAIFQTVVTEILRLLDEADNAGLAEPQPYPWLARGSDLSEVERAYELNVVPLETLTPDDQIIASRTVDYEYFDRLNFVVADNARGADFTAEVAVDGSLRGSMAVAVQPAGDRVRFVVGPDPLRQASDVAATNEAIRRVKEAADFLQIHYASGHVVEQGGVAKRNLITSTFPNWVWRDFGNYDVTLEKPSASTQAERYGAIGNLNDSSLFSWVIREWATDGFVTCDDGSNELADFVHLDQDETLSLIHVKASSTSGLERCVSASNYEQVIAQATKSLDHFRVGRIPERLSISERPVACWCNGQRQADRCEMVEFLRTRGPSARNQLVIVQPQMTLAAHDRGQGSPQDSLNFIRMRQVETMLHNCRSGATGLGADLLVVGCKTSIQGTH